MATTKCDPANNASTGRNSTDCSTSALFCYSEDGVSTGACYSRTDYNTLVEAAEAAATAESAEILADIYGEEGTPWYLIYNNQDTSDIDDYGLYDSFDFEYTLSLDESEIGSYMQYIGTGSVGLGREWFYDAYGNVVMRFYTTASSDAGPGNDPPTPSVDDEDDDTTTLEFSYSSTEKAALQSKFGSEIATYGNSTAEHTEAILEYLESFLYTKTKEIADTQIRPQFTFKKVKPPIFDNSVLSAFEETEEKQTVTTSLAYSEETKTDYGSTE